ncbi:hemagglutinin repeat-containing protein [Microvirga thermotolerans]|uniref:Colicin E3-like ribonuclease domain-containing protein n=1 Tax=Microvirga thermotolerans TaxID=2651334 RepID=A0A5P9JX64_9HYPH|nr:hemagglutinin repeat-containing protein [Microvirga thermotolerans]QFU16338.1 hypothetical protein GDR74_08930 [Microvirga thermotolerans]
MRQLQQAPATFTSGHGNAGLKAIGIASGTLQALDGIKQLTNPTVSVSATVGASGSRATSQSVSVTAVPTTIKAGSLSLNAGRDIRLVGTQADVVTDITLTAGRDLKVESARSSTATYSSSSDWHAGVGVAASAGASGFTLGLTAEGGLSRANASSWSETQVNAQLKAGGKVAATTGRDATFAGATVKAQDIVLDVGRNLTVTSRQDKAHGSTSSMNVGGSVTVGLIGPSSASVNVGGGSGSSDKAWVSEQTGLYATNRLDARVEKHTQLNGAVLNAATGQLTLDTGTLGYKDLRDHDRGSSVSGQVGVSTPGTPGQLPGVTVQGSYASHDREQTTRATVGAGTVTVRNEAKQKQDVKGINRDVTQAQVITKDRREGVNVYVSSDAIKEAVTDFAGIRQNFARLPQALADVPTTIKQAIRDTAEALDLTGKTFDQAADAMIDQQVKKGEVSAEDGRKLKAIKENIAKKEVQDAVVGCVGRQGFNMHDLLFTPAYAQGVCTIAIDGTMMPIDRQLASRALAVIYEAGVAAGAGTLALAGAFLIASTNSTGGSLNREIVEDDGTKIVLRGSGATFEKTLSVISPTGEETRYVIDRLPSGEFAVKEGFTITDAGTKKIGEQEMMDIADKALFGTGIIVAINGNPDQKYYPAPKSPEQITGFPGLKEAKNVSGRPRWTDGKGKIYEWDKQHGTLEVYDKTGKKHLGEFDPKTGNQTKPPVPGRTTGK